MESVVGGARRAARHGDGPGAHGVNLYRVGPGKESLIYHAHFMGFAANGNEAIGHHMRNPFSEELVYLVGGEHRDYDVGEFPKQGHRAVRRGKTVDLYKIDDVKKPFPKL